MNRFNLKNLVPVLIVCAGFAFAGILCTVAAIAGTTVDWNTDKQMQVDRQIVIFLQREDFTDEEIAELMILPRFPNIEHGQLTAGKQLSIRQDLRVAVLFDVFLSDSTDESWGCYTSTIIYDYCGTKDKENTK